MLFNLSGAEVISKCSNATEISLSQSFAFKNIGTLPLALYTSMIGTSGGCESRGFKVRWGGGGKNEKRFFLSLL